MPLKTCVNPEKGMPLKKEGAEIKRALTVGENS
jgi:hypothetical protein